MIINKNKFLEYLSNINDTKTLVSYSQDLDENTFSDIQKKFIGKANNYIYFANPSAGFSFFALGEIFSLGSKFKNKISIDRKLLIELNKNYYHNLNKINFNKVPLFIGAQKFPLPEKSALWKEFDFQKWFIPKYLLIKNQNHFALIINILGGEKNSESYLNDLNDLLNQKFENTNGGNNFHKTVRLYVDDTSQWNEMIYSCLQKISKKDLEKVVTARSVTIEIDSEINLKEIIDSLEENYPACYSFLYKNGGSAFFGATPEKLFKLDNGNIETDALAGSIQRGDSPASDNELGLQLLESEKDINEHNSVRNFLLEKLYNVTNDIKFDTTPHLRKLNNIQHLWTPITAKLKNDIDVLTLIENIFPTPAICGYPTETALKLIGSLENFDRGLYAGIIGWFNLDNEGEFAVALRSALLKDNLLHAFAGCGIVEGSNPISEYNETELKLKPILSLFVDETINQS